MKPPSDFDKIFFILCLANYAYLTSRKSEENGKAGRLISNAIDDTSDDHCVSFYYQLNGKKIRYLDFFIRTTTSKSFVNLWSMKEHQGNVWKRGGFTIPKQSEGYEVFLCCSHQTIYQISLLSKFNFNLSKINYHRICSVSGKALNIFE